MVGLDSTDTSCSVQSCSLEDTTCTTGWGSEGWWVQWQLNFWFLWAGHLVKGHSKLKVPWALPWDVSPVELLDSSFVDPSCPEVWAWLRSAERVTCCSVSVTSCLVCSLTSAVWKTGFGLIRTWRETEEQTEWRCSTYTYYWSFIIDYKRRTGPENNLSHFHDKNVHNTIINLWHSFSIQLFGVHFPLPRTHQPTANHTAETQMHVVEAGSSGSSHSQQLRMMVTTRVSSQHKMRGPLTQPSVRKLTKTKTSIRCRMCRPPPAFHHLNRYRPKQNLESRTGPYGLKI